MNRGLALTCVVLASLLMVSAPAEPVNYTQESRSILVGVWKGELIVERKCQGECRGGRHLQQRQVTLKVAEPTRGKFIFPKKSRSWLTDIKAKNGNPWMKFGKEMREFELSSDDGQYRLNLHFESSAKGYDKEHTLVLTKQ